MSSNDAFLKVVRRTSGRVESLPRGAKPQLGWHDVTKCPDCPACRKVRRLVKAWIDADAEAIRVVSEIP